jgi:hypothetical protein
MKLLSFVKVMGTPRNALTVKVIRYVIDAIKIFYSLNRLLFVYRYARCLLLKVSVVMLSTYFK